MKMPEAVSMFKSVYLTDEEEIGYCQCLNEAIKCFAVHKGVKVSDDWNHTTYVYEHDGLKCTYVEYEYGTNQYHFEISPELWNDIPYDVDCEAVYDEGYNLVYSYQDSGDRQVLKQFLPGQWVNCLTVF